MAPAVEPGCSGWG